MLMSALIREASHCNEQWWWLNSQPSTGHFYPHTPLRFRDHHGVGKSQWFKNYKIERRAEMPRCELGMVSSLSWVLGALRDLPLPTEQLVVMDSGEGQSLSSAVYAMEISKVTVTETTLVQSGESQKTRHECIEETFGGGNRDGREIREGNGSQ